MNRPTILERPVRIATLISILESAVANRNRQYKVGKLLEELELAKREAERAKEESDRASRAKSEFLANMSHEIRTPLGVVLGFTELAMEPNIPEEQRKSYGMAMRRNGQLLLALVNDILDLAKVESGKIETEAVEMPLLNLINEVVSALTPTAQNKNVNLFLTTAKNLPNIVKSDPTRLKQVLMNVVGNAVKFTAHGCVSLDVYFEELENDRTKLIFDVADTGLGISESQLLKLFKPFSQADSSMTREFGGTGLGLILSRQLARAMGGELQLVRSTPEVGSLFRISIPVGRVEKPEPVLADSTAIDQHKVKLEGLKVLLVEDSKDNQFLISHMLGAAGVSVEIADDGMDALDLTMNGEFDVVLMDIQMPRLDGNETTKRLRKKGYKRPIVALTANALKGDKEKAMDSGFDDYITKPILRNTLLETIHRVSQPKSASLHL